MASHREQVEALALLLAGQKCPLSPEDFKGTWRSAYSVLVESKSFVEARRRLEAVLPSWSYVRDILDALPESRPPHPSLKDLAPDLAPIEFLWPGWLPLGMLSLLGGDPGAGKSLLALDLARRVIMGGKFPDGSPITDPRRNVIYVDAENVPRLLNERADAWQIPKEFLFLMLPAGDSTMLYLDMEEEQERLFELCGDLDPAMVVIDSLGAASSRGENAVEEVREILGFLNTVAADFNAVMLLNHHLAKRNDPYALVRLRDFRGSGHIGAMARSVLGISVVQTSENPQDEAKRLDLVKTNLGLKPDPIGLEIGQAEDGSVTFGYGEPPIPYRSASKMEQCADWILEILEEADEPVKVGEILEMAMEEGFSRATVFRARKYLGDEVMNTEGRSSPNNMWVLVKQEES